MQSLITSHVKKDTKAIVQTLHSKSSVWWVQAYAICGFLEGIEI